MDAETRLFRAAATHHSVFTIAHARDHHLTEKAIRHRRESGRWTTMHRGVFVPAGVQIGWEQRVVAATFACGDQAVASFDSAAVVWEFVEELRLPWVTSKSGRCHPGIVVRRSSVLDATSYRGFRVTHPMRTLLDLAATTPDTVERYVDGALRRRLIDIERFKSFLLLERNLTRRGSGALREMLGVRDGGRPIGSDLETIFFSALRKAGLPLPVAQHPVRTRTRNAYIDFAYPDTHLAIELDGWEKYATPDALTEERARQNELEELGWQFRRFTWRQLTRDADGVAFTVGRGLGLRPVRWR